MVPPINDVLKYLKPVENVNKHYQNKRVMVNVVQIHRVHIFHVLFDEMLNAFHANYFASNDPVNYL